MSITFAPFSLNAHNPFRSSRPQAGRLQEQSRSPFLSGGDQDTLSLSQPDKRKSRKPLEIKNRATTQEVFEVLRHERPGKGHNYSLKHVLFHKKANILFKVDRSKYPQVLTNEQVAKNDSYSGRITFRDGFHQVLHSAAVLNDKNGPALVRLKGPILWPLDFDEQQLGKDPMMPKDQPATKASYRWQRMLRKLHEDTNAREDRSPRMMDVTVLFSSLRPEGYTDELDLVLTEDLPKYWAKKRLQLKDLPALEVSAFTE